MSCSRSSSPRPVGIWGVALSTLVTDGLALAYIRPALRGSCGPPRRPGRWCGRPTAGAAGARRGGDRARRRRSGLASPTRCSSSCRSGSLWGSSPARALWRFGLAPSERAACGRRAAAAARPSLRHLGRTGGSGRAPRPRSARASTSQSSSRPPRRAAAASRRARRVVVEEVHDGVDELRAASATSMPAPVSRRFAVTS